MIELSMVWLCLIHADPVSSTRWVLYGLLYAVDTYFENFGSSSITETYCLDLISEKDKHLIGPFEKRTGAHTLIDCIGQQSYVKILSHWLVNLEWEKQ